MSTVARPGARHAGSRSIDSASGGNLPVTAHHLKALGDALLCSKHSQVSGSTHGFYQYPARFSAAIARAVIAAFSEPGDWILDPFMGGGTSIVEGLALGRKMLGVDVNNLAWFVARVRTTPLSRGEMEGLYLWAARAVDRSHSQTDGPIVPAVKNLPGATKAFIACALDDVQSLQSRSQQDFARCVLLRLGQWAVDCRRSAPRTRNLRTKLLSLTTEMLDGVEEFVAQCRQAGMSRRGIVQSRRLACRSAVGLESDRRLDAAIARPRVVFTSPPYPGVHVLYHRWQYRGRRETSAPYWIASQRDGRFESFYTGGSRTPTGETRYFEMIEAAFSSVKQVMDPTGYVVQLVGFADTARQLPRYLKAMNDAGFREWTPQGDASRRLGRRVPNRKWYASIQGALDASSELLLIHSPQD